MKLSAKIFFISILLSIQSIAGGGWPQKKGKGYFKLGQFVLVANRYYNPEGNRIRVEPRISLFTTSIYGEYGLTDRITVVGYVPFFSRSVLNNLQKRNGEFVEGDQLTSFGDTDIGLKYGLVTDKRVVVSASVTFGIPFGNPGNQATSSSQTGTPNPEESGSSPLQTGDGEFNQKFTIEASTSFYPAPVYASVLVGVNNRTNGFSEEFHYGIEAGYTYKQLTLITKLVGVESFMNGTSGDNEQQSVFGNNIEFLMFSPELSYEFSQDKAGFTAGTSIALSGRQVLASPAYSAGVYIKL